MIARLLAALSDAERRRLLALAGRYPIGAAPDVVAARLAAQVAAAPDAFLALVQDDAALLSRLVRPFPGRAEALLAVARALGRRVPESEYVLPEDRLEALLARARALVGRRVPVRGAPGHKGRVGDGVERLLVGRARSGRVADHPAAEIKSVPVLGDQVIERVKLGVISPRGNPLGKCHRVLFVFVEQRGDDHFVRGSALREFDDATWRHLWEAGHLVETAAGSPRRRARGLYLTPKWFRSQGVWPAAG